MDDTTLDPFAFWPASASGVAGLGGPRPDPDPAYVFHTMYVPVSAGRAQCTIRFTDLSASFGALTLRINALPVTPNARAETTKVWTVQLRDVAEAGGDIVATFTATADTSYAVLGHKYMQSDASAQALEIRLKTLPGDAPQPVKSSVTHKSSFGRLMFRQANRMSIDGRATLADPVSQPCTAAQFEEPAYAEWRSRIQTPERRDREQWASVYILQTLKRYRMLTSGARGLGFGIGREPLLAMVKSFGCSVLATEHSKTPPPPETSGASVDAARAIDFTAIDDDLVDFDFVWSAGAMEHLGTIAAGLDFVRNSIDCLKYGGLAVHTTQFDLTSNGDSVDTVDNAVPVMFRRRNIEKIALDLVSRGHFVAQIKYDYDPLPSQRRGALPGDPGASHHERVGERYLTTSFGLIVRRGDR